MSYPRFKLLRVVTSLFELALSVLTIFTGLLVCYAVIFYAICISSPDPIPFYFIPWLLGIVGFTFVVHKFELINQLSSLLYSLDYWYSSTLPLRDPDIYWIPWSLHTDKTLPFSHNNYTKFTFAKAPSARSLDSRLTDILFKDSVIGKSILENLAIEYPDQREHFYTQLILTMEYLLLVRKRNADIVRLASHYLDFAKGKLSSIQEFNKQESSSKIV